MLMLAGELDRNVSLPRAGRIAADLRSGGAPAELRILPGAYHAWDGDDARRRRILFSLAGCELQLERAGRVRDERTGRPVEGWTAYARLFARQPALSGYHMLRCAATTRASDRMLFGFLRGAGRARRERPTEARSEFMPRVHAPIRWPARPRSERKLPKREPVQDPTLCNPPGKASTGLPAPTSAACPDASEAGGRGVTTPHGRNVTYGSDTPSITLSGGPARRLDTRDGEVEGLGFRRRLHVGEVGAAVPARGGEHLLPAPPGTRTATGASALRRQGRAAAVPVPVPVRP